MSKNSERLLGAILSEPKPGQTKDDQLREERWNRGEKRTSGKDEDKGKDKKTK